MKTPNTKELHDCAIPKPEPLSEHYKANLKTLLTAAEDGQIALVSAVRKADNKSVALVCAMQRNADDSLTPVPFAVMVEGDPFELFHDPTK